MLDVEIDTRLFLRPSFAVHGLLSQGLFWVFNLETGEHYELNETAYWVVQRLQGSGMLWGELLAQFLQEFEVGPLIAEKDLLELLNELCNEGMLECSSKSNGGGQNGEE